MGYNTVYLHIAEMIVAETGVKLCTVLGSCVSVCLYSPERKIGGMIHFALPGAADLGPPERHSEQNDLRVGDRAIPLLIQNMCERTGMPAASFQAKIVGGAAVLESLKHATEIGKRNVEVTDQILRQAGIKIVSRDVGGTTGRKVYFYSDSGRIEVRPVTS